MTSAPLVDALLRMDEEPLFTFATRRVGDQGTYRQWWHEPGKEPQLLAISANWHVMAWRWGQPEHGPLGLDRHGAVNVLEVDVDSPPESLAGRVFFEPVTFDPIGFERLDAPSGAWPPFQQQTPATVGPLAWKGLFFFPNARESAWGCIHSLPTEGIRIFAGTAALTFPTVCFAQSSWGWQGEIKLVLDRVEDSPQGRRLHAHVEHEDMKIEATRYTFLEGVPEPVEIQMHVGEGRFGTMVLDNFTRGDGPPLTRDTQEATGSWRMVPPFGESAAWPMSDGLSGMDLPFATAFVTATAHPMCGEELSRFWAEHPRAFAFMAQSSTHIRDDGNSRRAWWFRFGDAIEARDFEVSVRGHPFANTPAECAWRAVAYAAGDVRPGGIHDWDLEWPTARSLMENYAVLAPDAPPARDVGWQIGCFGQCAPGVRDFRHVDAGRLDFLYSIDTTTGGGVPAVITDLVSTATLTAPSSMELDLLAWSKDDSFWSLINRAQVVPAGRAAELAPASPPAKAAAGPSLLSSAPVAFDWSAERVAWYVSLLGGLLGLLYYLGPVVRDGALMGFFSRLQDDQLLDHPTRKRIHHAVGEDPGIHLRELARRVGIGVTTLRHHLLRLTKAGIVVSHKDGRYECYALPGSNGSANAIRGETAQRLFDLVGSTPGISPSSAAQELAVDRATVSRQAARLEKGGHIVVERRGRAMLLRPPGQPLYSDEAANSLTRSVLEDNAEERPIAQGSHRLLWQRRRPRP